jgi:hypothetical protein
MKSTSSEITTNAIATDDMINENHIRNPNDISFVTINENETDIKFGPRDLVVPRVPIPVIYEMSPKLANRSSDNSQQQRESMDLGPYERQLSLLDPLSDRVTTILVWQNLIVSSREDRHKEIFKKLKSCNNYVSKRKCLLNNVSGAITGGLWAVMGELSFLFSCISHLQL